MQRVYSRVEDGTLLHVIIRKSDAKNGRVNMSPAEEFLQIAQIGGSSGSGTEPHKHPPLDRRTSLTQESWVVIEGRVRVTFFDLDDAMIGREVLESGDCGVTFRGGHMLEMLDDRTLFYEYKTGPYFGEDLDRAPIGGKEHEA